MKAVSQGYKSTMLDAFGSATGRFVGVLCLTLCNAIRVEALIAVDDQARTVQNMPISIPVLANDWDAASNQLAILQVTAPAHGKITVNSGGSAPPAELTHLIGFAVVQFSNTVAQVGDTNRYPRGTAQTNGIWRTRTAASWVSGFFPGILWYLNEATSDARFSEWAQNWMGAIAPQAVQANTTDLGFMVNNSFGNGYRLTGNPQFKAMVLQAAQSVSNLYNAAVGCIGDWGTPSAGSFETAIDYMMNTELLFRAAALGGDRGFYTMAFNNAQRSMTDLVRPDGSTYQIADYDRTTGALLKQGTYAGVSDESTWARGQAWGIYGFTMAYRETGDARFLNTAQRLADYYLTNVPPDQVPYWDFQAPDIPSAPRDSSAAAITLSALVELAGVATNFEDSEKYWQAAHRLFTSLRSTNYLAEGTVNSGLLLHGTGEPPQWTDLEVDVCLIYGDYYYVEALKRLTDIYSHTSLTYVPDKDFLGTDTFQYEVCDSGGNCSTATVTVVVSPAATNVFAAQISLAPDTRWPTISFPTLAGQFYQVQYSDGLAPGPWSILATNLAGSGAAVSVTDTNPAARRFYRVGAWPR